MGFGDRTDVKAEKLLNKYKPDILKKDNLNDVFTRDTKLKDIHKKYYKYTIIFKNNQQQDDMFKEILNYDLKNKNFSITVNEILEHAKKQDSAIDNIDSLSKWLAKSKAKVCIRKYILGKNPGLNEGDVNSLIDMLVEYSKNNGENKYYVSTAILADKSLDAYLQGLEEKRTVKFAVNELKKIAKHVLKALSALHNDGVAHRDLHAGNITRTVINPEGKPQKIKYSLIDFGAVDSSKDNSKTIKNDLHSLGYGVLIPVFYQIINPDIKLEVSNSNNFKKISEMKNIPDMDETFIDFLNKLENGFNSSDEALKHDFIKKK